MTAHELCPGETRLFGTESLYGDWGGRVLLLAKDFASSCFVRRRIEGGEPRPYRHECRMITNRRLVELARPLEELGLLYGSALANLLRDDGKITGALPNRAEALEYGARVLRFVLAHMPARRWVVCLGDDAWDCATRALGLEGDWRARRESAEPLGPLVAAFHPAARVSRERLSKPWKMLERVERS
ncbi:MAG: hypothetical protein ACREI8_06185 [Myxococcota bacterium]